MINSIKSIFYFNDWGYVIFREIDFLLKICWSIPCLHPSWKVHTWVYPEVYIFISTETFSHKRRFFNAFNCFQVIFQNAQFYFAKARWVRKWSQAQKHLFSRASSRYRCQFFIFFYRRYACSSFSQRKLGHASASMHFSVLFYHILIDRRFQFYLFRNVWFPLFHTLQK